MYLKSLTLRGFKSFASATTLTFEPGITCVVGPNGSGKSNVVDALSWVLGEQGAKTLRGGKMEDVIFAGTSARAPLGRAEVVLTIDNSDGALPIDYTEVTISRTMFRNGGSDYAINGNAARLLDVQELLSDSGIGREMHVIVGQGQLDSILQSTPEGRRGFIEEAAGVLKHRKRKEKALRKLEATEANLNRLADLVTELRRQLKPLGRQAEVARKAAVIQAEVRDARARLLADELVRATVAMASVLADDQAIRDRRLACESALESARAAELEAEEAVRECVPRLSAAQETWYALAALKERVATTSSIAKERVRHTTDDAGELPAGRDPAALDSEAEAAAVEEASLAQEVAARTEELRAAGAHRSAAEQASHAEDVRLAALLRAAADRREGLARLTGQVNSLRSRAEATAAEVGRLHEARAEALERAERADRAFTALENTVAGLDAGEVDLDAEHEKAASTLTSLKADLSELRGQERAATQERAALTARVEALQVGLSRADASSALLATTDRVSGVLGSVAELVRVQPGYESAVAAALGPASEAVAVAGLDAAVSAVRHLKAEDLGRTTLLLGGTGSDTETWPDLPAGARYALDVVEVRDDLRAAVRHALSKVAVVEDLEAARVLVELAPDLVAVTRDGDLVGRYLLAGGSSAAPGRLEVQAAIEETQGRLSEVNHACERLRFSQSVAEERLRDATEAFEATLVRLHESDATLAAVAEELGQLSATARSAHQEADRLERSAATTEDSRSRDLAGLSGLESRLQAAAAVEEEPDPDSAERDRLAAAERAARSVEMEARLALRTVEERARGLAGRAAALRQAAAREREVRDAALARRERLRREGETARAVLVASTHLAGYVERSLALAATARSAVETARAGADAALSAARASTRTLTGDFESLLDAAHREELAGAEQRMRIEGLAEKALVELGIEPDLLTAEFGPDQLVPVFGAGPTGGPTGDRADRADGADEDRPSPVPYVREQQQKRLRVAERDLAVLGRVNPLALEEFSALEERHQFLVEQLDDLRRTRHDLTDIIADVDTRVQQVFAEAYADVERAFAQVFARLFPGGEGRLVLTEPGDWLSTGVEVEARPAGKKVKRLSLLSGGERSLVAVAFLVSLFIARPSPFYILDEVEAALDDTNLGRLLDIYAELRASSQLLVITHQKRTMEIADALYGVTMRGDGVSAVISQRLRESVSVA